ncbi:MAG: DUF2461 domain-containing protein [bacterium]|nr:DUF2461 domain-containing protein [bacterium]MBK9305392.1 DUF2461 domain-containing protein [bacterium]
MIEKYQFAGFPPTAVRFFEDLARHNDRDWFLAHKPLYQEAVLDPARAFVVEMGVRLRRLAPQIQFDPRTDGSGSIFRIHRDVRFSKDKSPYKTHLGIFFWEGQRKWGPGFYFHLEPPRLQLYVGKYVFDKEGLAAWRAAVADPVRGAALAKLTAKIERQGYELGGQHYKRVPAGFAADHPRAELLKHDSIWVRHDGQVPAELKSRELLDYCQAHYKAMSPLHGWLREFPAKDSE